MSKEQVIDYVMTTPGNPNRAVLSGMLDDLASEGSGGLEYVKDAPDIDGDKSYAVIENNVEGEYPNVASGYSSHAEGDSTTASGESSHAEGCGTTASGDYSHAGGYQTTASGYSSHAEGDGTTASDESSHAEGCATTASGSFSHAEGNSTTASGDYSHAGGYQTTASGDYSHAEGCATTASGDYSHAGGDGTTANHKSQHVFGEYNVADPSTASSTNRGTYVEIVGNGISSNRSNARTLDWSGNESLQGSLTLGKGTADEVTITATQLKALLATLNA
jgi:hypothetical protein